MTNTKELIARLRYLSKSMVIQEEITAMREAADALEAMSKQAEMWRSWRERALKAEEENNRLRKDAKELRFLLAVRVAGGALYMDDGELSDGSTLPAIDFKRDSVKDIEDKLYERGLRNFARQMSEFDANRKHAAIAKDAK